MDQVSIKIPTSSIASAAKIWNFGLKPNHQATLPIGRPWLG
jgi:hypothetical protein